MVNAFEQVDATEKRLTGMWRKRGFNIPSIAELLDRGKGTISRQVEERTPTSAHRQDCGEVVSHLFHHNIVWTTVS